MSTIKDAPGTNRRAIMYTCTYSAIFCEPQREESSLKIEE